MAMTPRRLVRLLAERGLTLAVAESCTGGQLSAAVTSVPGSSAVFRGGVVAYADDAKRLLLRVPVSVLRRHGAVSRQCAEAMAKGARLALRADLAVAVTGIAGPTGAVPGKPVGTVWLAVVADGRITARRRRFPGGRIAVQQASFREALAMVGQALDKANERPNSRRPR